MTQFNTTAAALIAGVIPAARCTDDSLRIPKVGLFSRGGRVYVAGQCSDRCAISSVATTTETDWHFTCEAEKILNAVNDLAGSVAVIFAKDSRVSSDDVYQLELRTDSGSTRLKAWREKIVLPPIDAEFCPLHLLDREELHDILRLKTWGASDDPHDSARRPIGLRFTDEGWRAVAGNGTRYQVIGKPRLDLAEPIDTFLIQPEAAAILKAVSPSFLELRRSKTGTQVMLQWRNTCLLVLEDSARYSDERRYIGRPPRWIATFHPKQWRKQRRAMLDVIKSTEANSPWPTLTLKMQPDRTAFVLSAANGTTHGTSMTRLLPVVEVSIKPEDDPDEEITVFEEYFDQLLGECDGDLAELHCCGDAVPITLIPSSGDNQRVMFMAQAAVKKTDADTSSITEPAK